MIKLLYFSYALHKQKVLNLIAIFYFRFDKSFLAEGVKVQFVLDFPPLWSTPLRSCLQVTSSYSQCY